MKADIFLDIGFFVLAISRISANLDAKELGMKKQLLGLSAMLFFGLSSQAQIAIFDKEAIEKDFAYNLNLYASEFAAPVIESYSSSQIASNHTTAKVLQPFAVSFGFQASGTFVESSDLTFNYNDVPFSDNFVLTNPRRSELPTVLGGSTTAEFIYRIQGQSVANPGTILTFEEKFSAIDGITSPADAIPAGAFHLAVGLPMNTEVFLRALPTFDFNGVENYMVGAGVKHQISQYFMEEESPMHVALAGFYGKSNFSFVPESTFDGDWQEISFTDNTYSFESIISYDKDFYSFFGLVGFYGGKSEFAIDGNYQYNIEQDIPGPTPPVSQEAFTLTNPVSIKNSSSGVQAAMGFSLKFYSYVSMTAAYHIAEKKSLAVNLRFAINNGKRN